MLKRLDESGRLSRLLEVFSTALSSRRGLPMLVGFSFIIISFFCMALLLPLLVIADRIPSIWLWLCLPFGLLYAGILLGFLGFMLATPLGEGYQEH